MSINELEAKARELRQLQALIDEAQAEAEALKDTIGDQDSIQAGEYRITWKAVTSSRIDTTALRKALPDVAKRFTKETTAYAGLKVHPDRASWCIADGEMVHRHR